MEEDRYQRNTDGYLPNAKIAFIDECFRANSAILNSMLGILNERVYFEHGRAMPVPLEMCVSATNDLPDDDAGLDALYDRFLFRQVVRSELPTKTPSLNTSSAGSLWMGPRSSLTRWKLPERRLRGSNFIPEIIKNIIQLKVDMSKQKPGIVVSDRRWQKR